MKIGKMIAMFVVLAAVVVGFFLLFPSLKKTPPSLNLPPATPGIEEQIKQKFGGLDIPEDAERTELKNVSEDEGIGIATRSEILADLPDLEKGESYQALLSDGSKTILLGNLRLAKGGYILEYDSSKYPGFNQIVIMKGSKRILEGSF